METVLITGANRGIGLELAARYSQAGARVLACCRDVRAAGELKNLADVHDHLTVYGVSVSDGESVAELASSIDELPFDILINNAGTPGPSAEHQSALDMDFSGWMETFAVNTMAPLRMLQTFRNNLKAGTRPRAVTITSQMGALDLNMPVMYAYCSSKAAVNKIMRMISVELSGDGIAVGLLHPGWVKTDMGGASAQISAEESVTGIMSVIDALTLDNTGSFQTWQGESHAW